MKKIIIILINLNCLLPSVHFCVAQEAKKPEISKNVWFQKSIPLREMTVVLPGKHIEEQKVAPNRFSRGTKESLIGKQVDKVEIQDFKGHRQCRGPLLNIPGVGNVNSTYPADPNAAVGPDHIVQGVNLSFGVWDKNGNKLYGPVDYNTIWASFPGPWNSNKWGDPEFKYDYMADRWIISSMSLGYNSQPPFFAMVAVSVTNDPLGEYYCYAFHYNIMNDYPKLSVWPDGYYLTHNMWDEDDNCFPMVSILDRDAMLLGQSSITRIDFAISEMNTDRFFPVAADMRGDSIPTGIPNYIVTIGNHDTTNLWHLWLDVYEFVVDWQNTSNSQFERVLEVDLGNFEPCINFAPGSPQMGSDTNVMTIPFYMMYPVTYRMFDGHESLVCTHTVWDGSIHYIKWYELRREGAGWFLYQTGNYAPEGDKHYFMPSISINGNGDMALGYNICNENMYPSIRFTGRRYGDSLGVMTFEEIELYKGLNYANSYHDYYDQNRWGDYASMMVDPFDDSTFWFCSMYTTASASPGNWATRIFSLDLSEDTLWPYSNAGNDTIAPNIVFFQTQGEAKNYSSIHWTTSGDGNFLNNYSENVTYLRGPEDLQKGQVALSMHVDGYYSGTWDIDSMILYLLPVCVAEESSPEKTLRAYPNPAKDIVTIQADNLSENQLILQVATYEGKELFRGKYAVVNGQFKLKLDLSHLKSGIYFFRLTTRTTQLISKVVVNH
jgi:hypothetical protein